MIGGHANGSPDTTGLYMKIFVGCQGHFIWGAPRIVKRIAYTSKTDTIVVDILLGSK